MVHVTILKAGLGAALAASVAGALAAGGPAFRGGPQAGAERPRAGKGDPRPKADAAPLPADDARSKEQSVEKLKRIGLAIHQYTLQNDGRLPAGAIVRGGKPLLSWRVAILPFMGEKALYDKFRLDEPWDSPHNKALLKEMPAIYAPPARAARADHATYYQGFVGPGAVFQIEKETPIGRITDGRHRTIAVAEAATPVPWTKPEDLAFSEDEAKPLPRVGGLFEGGFHALLADFSVRPFATKKVEPRVLRALITTDGLDPVSSTNDLDDLKP